jgi:protein gp37
MIFPNSTGDIFHEALSDAEIDMVVVTMAMANWHTFQPLTKRVDRMRDYLSQDRNHQWAEAADRIFNLMGRDEMPWVPEHNDLPFPNIWWGVSVENQEWADKRREDFRAVPSRIKVVSYEPALGPVDWTGWEFVDQIIGGGESGPRARPMHPDWQRTTRDFCAENGIAYFFKQWGEHAWVERLEGDPSTLTAYRAGKKAAGRLLDGVEHNGVPAHG